MDAIFTIPGAIKELYRMGKEMQDGASSAEESQATMDAILQNLSNEELAGMVVVFFGTLTRRDADEAIVAYVGIGRHTGIWPQYALAEMMMDKLSALVGGDDDEDDNSAKDR